MKQATNRKKGKRSLATCIVAGLCTVLAVGLTTQRASTQAVGGKMSDERLELFTAEQAERGEEAYETHCASCHGSNLEGGGHFPALQGERFWRRWEGRTVWELYEYTHDAMPLGQGGSLEEETYADIIAFMLEHYGYESGDEELVPDEERLDDIPLESRNESADDDD